MGKQNEMPFDFHKTRMSSYELLTEMYQKAQIM